MVYPRRHLRLALVQMPIYPGEPARNAAQALRALRQAAEAGADLAVFPEMALPGYLLGDLWERSAFIAACEEQNQMLVAATGQIPCAALFGTVATVPGEKGQDGRPLKCNAFVFAKDGQSWKHPRLGLGFGVKTLHPDYREFEDSRHFYDTRRLAMRMGGALADFLNPVPAGFAGGEFRLGAHLCEDAWQDDYSEKPIDLLARAGADILLNLSSSPFTRGKNGKRNRVFGAHCARLRLPLAYVNGVSLQNNAKTIYAFDGRSTLYACDGSIALELPAFEAAMGIATLTWDATNQGDASGGVAIQATSIQALAEIPVAAARPTQPQVHSPTPSPMPSPAPSPSPVSASMAEIHAALRFGISRFLRQIGLDKVVIGVSGGIDSAVSAALFRDILPPENLLLVNMPSRFNGVTTRGLAEALAKNLGCPYLVLPIDQALSLTQAQIEGEGNDEGASSVTPNPSSVLASPLAPAFRPVRPVALTLSGPALENVQARDRGARLLAGLAAAFGGVFACNTNKTEMTVGYGTLYGDIAGFLAPLADLWKGEVYALGRYLNEAVFRKETIPEGIFRVIPSAELSADQSVEEGKGDPLIYPYHDKLFFAFVQRWNRASPEDLLQAFLDGGLNAYLGLVEVDAYALFPKAPEFIADLERWWELYNGLGVVKRLQAPPVLAVSSRAFGFDHRDSLLPSSYSETYRRLKARALGHPPE